MMGGVIYVIFLMQFQAVPESFQAESTSSYSAGFITYIIKENGKAITPMIGSYIQLVRRYSVSKMIFKLGVFIAFLYVTISVDTLEYKENESISAAIVGKKLTVCEVKLDFLKGVQKYKKDVNLTFKTFPKQVAKAADGMEKAFEALVSKAIELSESNSTILSSGATEILEAFSQVKLKNHSAQGGIDEFDRVLPILIKAFRKVVKKFTKQIGSELVCAVNDAIGHLEYEFKCYVKEFRKGDGNVRNKEVNYEPVMKRAQMLVDIVAVKCVAELNECQLRDPDVQHVLLVLSLITNYAMILVHGLSTTSEAVLVEQKCDKPVVLHMIVEAVGEFISEITESIVANTVPNTVNVLEHLLTLAHCSSKLNATLTKLFESVEQITQQLTNGLQGTTTGLLKPLLSIG